MYDSFQAHEVLRKQLGLLNFVSTTKFALETNKKVNFYTKFSNITKDFTHSQTTEIR